MHRGVSRLHANGELVLRSRGWRTVMPRDARRVGVVRCGIRARRKMIVAHTAHPLGDQLDAVRLDELPRTVMKGFGRIILSELLNEAYAVGAVRLALANRMQLLGLLQFGSCARYKEAVRIDRRAKSIVHSHHLAITALAALQGLESLCQAARRT